MNEEEKAAQERVYAAKKRRAAIQDQQEERERAAIEAVRAEFRDALRTADMEVQAAQSALDEVRIQLGASKGPAIGTRYLEYDYDPFGSLKWTPTGRVGVIEMRTKETQFPENIRWGLPFHGDKFIRILKKDGTPGMAFKTLNGLGNTWKPE